MRTHLKLQPTARSDVPRTQSGLGHFMANPTVVKNPTLVIFLFFFYNKASNAYTHKAMPTHTHRTHGSGRPTPGECHTIWICKFYMANPTLVIFKIL